MVHFTRTVGVLGVLLRGAVAEIDCSASFNITDANDAKELRESCTELEGDLLFGAAIQNINLDGLETINGSVGQYLSGGSLRQDFEISSSTLEVIRGNLGFSQLTGLEGLSFPNLRNVGRSLSLDSDSLRYLDLTSLEYVGQLELRTESLETLSLTRLRGFNDMGQGSGKVKIIDAGEVTSLDGIFASPLEPVNNGDVSDYLEVYLDYENIRYVRTLTFGWVNNYRTTIGGKGLTLILGGPDTTQQYLANLNITDGVEAIRRSGSMENLTVGTFSMNEQLGMHTLSLPFDQLTLMEVNNNINLGTIDLPEEASQWESRTIQIEYNRNLFLPGLDEDGDSLWHWPKKIDLLRISQGLEREFISDLFDQDPDIKKVILDVRSDTSRLSCYSMENMFEKRTDVDEFECVDGTVRGRVSTNFNTGVPTAAVSRGLGVVLTLGTFLMFCVG